MKPKLVGAGLVLLVIGIVLFAYFDPDARTFLTRHVSDLLRTRSTTASSVIVTAATRKREIFALSDLRLETASEPGTVLATVQALVFVPTGVALIFVGLVTGKKQLMTESGSIEEILASTPL